MSGAKMAWSPILHRQQLFVVCLGACMCVNSSAADWTLVDLMQLLAQQKSGKANFVEKKYMSILDRPLESSGELTFDAPNRLEKRTLKPRPETMLLDGDKLTLTSHEKRPVHLRLQDHPEVASVVESIRGTLSGDKAALERNYTVDLAGVQAKWQLTLVPVQNEVAKILRRVHISGADANIRIITFDQTDGDRFEMTVSKVAAP